jgi:hypothetical protein
VFALSCGFKSLSDRLVLPVIKERRSGGRAARVGLKVAERVCGTGVNLRATCRKGERDEPSNSHAHQLRAVVVDSQLGQRGPLRDRNRNCNQELGRY